MNGRGQGRNFRLAVGRTPHGRRMRSLYLCALDVVRRFLEGETHATVAVVAPRAEEASRSAQVLRSVLHDVCQSVPGCAAVPGVVRIVGLAAGEIKSPEQLRKDGCAVIVHEVP